MTTHEPGGRSDLPFETDHDDFDDELDALVEEVAASERGPLARIRGAAQLIGILPHLLGYHVDHSLVVVATGVDRHPHTTARSQAGGVEFTARVDLPEVGDLPALIEPLRGPLRRVVEQGPSVVLLHAFAYDPPVAPDGSPDPQAVAALQAMVGELAAQTGSHLFDLVVVGERAQELWPVVAGGEPVAQALAHWSPAPGAADVPAAADLVLSGQGVHASRAELVAAVRRRDERASSATELALSVLDLDPLRLDEEQALHALSAWVVSGVEPTARDRAWIALTLMDRTWRDAVLARWVPQTFPLGEVIEDARQRAQFRAWVGGLAGVERRVAVDRLLTLTGQVPRSLGAPLLTLAAMLSWSHGDGTIAGEACELALEVDPHYRMARLLQDGLQHGVRAPGSGRRRSGSSGRRGSPGTRPAA